MADLKDLLSVGVSRPPNTRLLTAFGKTQSLTEWAEEYGIYPATLSARLKRGAKLEDSLHKGNRAAPAVDITAFGRTQRLAKWAEEYGLNSVTLHSRIKRGVKPEDALTTKPGMHTRASSKRRVDPYAKRREKLRADLVYRSVVTKAAEGVPAFVKLLAVVDDYLECARGKEATSKVVFTS